MTSQTESFGLVLIEAMSYGLPCIGFDCASGAREIISKKNGVLVQNRDKNKMAMQIIELLNNSSMLSDLSKGSLETSQKYLLENVKKLWIKLLEAK